MKKIELKWDILTEKKIVKILKKIAYSNTREKTKTELEKLASTLMSYSLKLEKSFKKKKDIDILKHKEIVTEQIKETIEWKENIKDKEISNKKMKNNINFRARNMQGNYYKDFLKKIASIETSKFEWITMGDERVRPEHMEREGEIYDINTTDLLPGEDPGCRCTASLIFD